MTLLETISVRLFEPRKANLVQVLFKQLDKGTGGADKPDAASLFSSCNVPGDWIIQLTWLGNGQPKAKTTLGRHLAESFRSIGLVHHTVWQGYSTAMINGARKGMRGEEYEV